MKNLIILLLICIVANINGLQAQVSINTDGSTPDNSAMLDIQSTNKGMLIPRMTTAERNAISGPATGLMVFDNDTGSFWFYTGSGWQAVGADNLGNHTATQNLKLNGNYLSGDGGNEGVFVDGNGNVGINAATPKKILHVGGDYYGRGHLWFHANEGDGSSGTAYLQARDDSGSSSISMRLRTQNAGSIVDAVQIAPNGNVGIGTSSPDARLDIEGGALLAQGTTGATPVSGAGTRLMWVPDKAAFRAGEVGGTQWDTGNIGASSFVGGGYSNTASGDNSFVGGGLSNTASGLRSFVGGGNSHSASGFEAFVGGGGGNTASGNGAFVGGGESNTASGNNSFIGGGIGLLSQAYAEAVFGTFNTYHTPTSANSYSANDRVFVIGNGTSESDRSDAFTVLKNGRIGIGTSNPFDAKVSIIGALSRSLTYGYLNGNGNIGTASGTAGYSLYADERIAAVEFNAFSDARIKNIIGVSDHEQDLSTLMDIEVTDYTLLDTIAKGTQSYKKVIAQQVETVFPQAVSTITDVVPDIYQRAGVVDGWVQLATDLQPGNRVKIITEKSAEMYEVTQVEESRFLVPALKTQNLKLETVFVYGREVDDFHTVDYEAIAMLNVSATQELARRSEGQQRRIETLEKVLETQTDRINQLEAMLLQFQSRGNAGNESVSAKK